MTRVYVFFGKGLAWLSDLAGAGLASELEELAAGAEAEESFLAASLYLSLR